MRPPGKRIALGVGMILFMMEMSCYTLGGRISGGMKEKQIQGINHGQTTRQQILDWFGEPNAVARQDGGFLYKPLGPYITSQEFSGKAFFKLFSEKHLIRPRHIIYYYQHFPNVGATGVLTVPTEKVVVIERLWVLMDQETEKVEDHIFKKESKIIQPGGFE